MEIDGSLTGDDTAEGRIRVDFGSIVGDIVADWRGSATGSEFEAEFSESESISIPSGPIPVSVVLDFDGRWEVIKD